MRRHFIFVDKNQDGINDVFCDKNGDGVNDVTGIEYPHKFRYKDENKDGINDIYIDMDGDGVNDLYVINNDTLKDNIVIDVDDNGINDITGLKYYKGNYRGNRYGKVLEEDGIVVKNYIDKNKNGMYDRIENKKSKFIDENGNGIDDRIEKYKHRRGDE